MKLPVVFYCWLVASGPQPTAAWDWHRSGIEWADNIKVEWRPPMTYACPQPLGFRETAR